MKRNDLGVSLMDLLITVVILSTALVSILSFFNSSMKANIVSQTRSKIMFVAEEEMEKRISLDYFSPALEAYNTNGGRTDLYERDEYLVKAKIEYLDPATGEPTRNIPTSRSNDTKLKRITISVARQDGSGPQIDLVTNKTP